MKPNNSRTRWFISVAVMLLLAPALVGPALAQCTYTPLVSGVSQATTSSPNQYFTINQVDFYWAAVGVRGAGADDWDIAAFADSDVSPACVSNLLASSTENSGIVDFVIGDFNTGSATLDTYYLNVLQYSGSSAATVEWDAGIDLLNVNEEPKTWNTDATDVIRVWDTLLQAGFDYEFHFETTGSADMKILVFGPPTSSPFWLSRNQALGEWSTDFTINVPTTDIYGVVVVNDNGGTGTYDLNILGCDSRLMLTSGVVNAPVVWQNHYEFTQVHDYWTAIGYRRMPGDVDLSLYRSPIGGDIPICMADSLAGAGQPDSGLVFFA